MLKRQLGLWQTVLLGIGIMVGAGIYVLIGVAAVEAGSALWFSFLIGAILAMLTAFSYAELSSMYPNAGSSYFYSKQAFGSRRLSFLLGWFLIVAYTAASTTVAFGFSQYLNSIIPIPQELAAVSILFLLGLLNYIGLREASRFNILATFLEVGGLVALIFLFFASTDIAGLDFSLDPPKGIDGMVTAAILVFFAYLGFEVLATAAEEIRDVKKTLPRAILISIALTSLIYVLTALAFTSALSYDAIVQTVDEGEGALAAAAGQFGGEAFLLALVIIGLFSTGNTILISLIGVSRMMYGMAEDRALPSKLLQTTKSGVPGLAIIFATFLSILLAFFSNLSTVARISVSGMFMIFIFDNLSVIALRLKKPEHERQFKIPFSIANIPLLPVLSVLFIISLLILEFASDQTLLLGFLALAATGLILNESEYRLTGD
ncbi:hypothetical protein DRN67_01910 [Candidatus Micrarchaeota archaeon]|nr:MAG: hypothetical protein DRN67_01910 [Candidatus Micrarchaeota archaeon]